MENDDTFVSIYYFVHFPAAVSMVYVDIVFVYMLPWVSRGKYSHSRFHRDWSISVIISKRI